MKNKNTAICFFYTIITLSLLLGGTYSFAQSSEWKLSGNSNVNPGSFIGTTTLQPLEIKTNDESRLFITPDGKVGIGTKTPAADLTVTGTVQFESFSGIDTRPVLADPNGNLFPAPLKPGPGGNDPNYCDQMTWTAGGNYIQSDCYLGTNNQEDLVIKTAGFEKMRVTVDGNVGIIQPNPVARLHVGQNFPFTYSQKTNQNAMGFNCYWNGLGGSLTQIGQGRSAFINFDDGLGHLHLAANPDQGAQNSIGLNQNGIFVKESGYVGIGNATPEAMLHVYGDAFLDGNARIDGQVCARRVTVHQGQGVCWPDYVFADQYNLRSLEEVDCFIKDNQHLPGIPSAKEVDKNGFEVGEMTKALLEKVEELTLYMIQLKKENVELKERLSNLETQK